MLVIHSIIFGLAEEKKVRKSDWASISQGRQPWKAGSDAPALLPAQEAAMATGGSLLSYWEILGPLFSILEALPFHLSWYKH